MVTVLYVGPDKSGQVRTGVKYYFSSTVSPTPFKFSPPRKPACSFLTSLETLRPSEVVESLIRHASVGVKCELVGCATFLRRTTMSKISFESSRLGEFECEISPGQDLRQKKLWHSIVPARRPSEHTGLGPSQKGVNCNFSWPEFDKPFGVRKLSISDA